MQTIPIMARYGSTEPQDVCGTLKLNDEMCDFIAALGTEGRAASLTPVVTIGDGKAVLKSVTLSTGTIASESGAAGGY